MKHETPMLFAETRRDKFLDACCLRWENNILLLVVSICQSIR